MGKLVIPSIVANGGSGGGGGSFDPTQVQGYSSSENQELINDYGTLKWAENTITISDITSFQIPNTPLGTELPMPVLDDIKDVGVYKINFDLSAMAPGVSVLGILEVSDMGGGSIQQWYQTCMSDATFIFSRTYDGSSWGNWFCISGLANFYTPYNLVAGSNISITSTTDESGYDKYSINAAIPTPTLTWYTNNIGNTIDISNISSTDFIEVYKNGMLLENTQDYTISGTTLTLATALIASDKISIKTNSNPSANINQQERKHIFNTIAGGSNYSAFIGQTVLPWYNENKPFVFQFDFKTTGLASFRTGNTSQGILISGSYHYNVGIEVVLDGTESATNNYKARLGMGMTTANSTWNLFWVWGDYDIEPLTKYNFRITYDLTKYTVEYKKDTATTWKLLQEVASSTKLYCGSQMYLNAQGSSNQNAGWSGTAIDLNSFKATSGATTLIDGLESLRNVLGFYSNPLINEFYE